MRELPLQRALRDDGPVTISLWLTVVAVSIVSALAASVVHDRILAARERRRKLEAFESSRLRAELETGWPDSMRTASGAPSKRAVAIATRRLREELGCTSAHRPYDRPEYEELGRGA